ncbi:unnamed protein product [Chrysoparadoxa australica]
MRITQPYLSVYADRAPVLPLISIGYPPTHLAHLLSRRQTLVLTAASLLAIPASPARAVSLTQASSKQKLPATIAALAHVLKVKTLLEDGAAAVKGRDLALARKTLASVPEATKLKAVFDAYAGPVSYSTRVKENNAFLIYYTGGYDGTGRAKLGSREEEEQDPSIARQAEQYGLRNEVIFQLAEANSLLDFVSSSGPDEQELPELAELQEALASAVTSIDKFLALASPDDLRQAAEGSL